jgi:plastocyanin
MRITTRHGVAVLMAGYVFLVGCGGGDDDDNGGGGGGGGGSGGAAASTVNLSAIDFKFDPSDVSAKKGVVEFKVKNDGQTTHALEVEGGGVEEVKTSDIAPGDSASLKVDLSKASGEVEFYCPIDNHKAMGMEGKISVGGGSSSSSDTSDQGSGGGY